MEKYIIASIIGTSQKEIDQRIAKVKNDVNIIQLDVMDGKFVNNTSIDFNFSIPKGPIYEAHLMINNPKKWIEKHAHKVDLIYIHQETIDDYDRIINLVRSKDKKIGFALNPETPIDNIRGYLHLIDAVLIMTVHPGEYGAKFLPEQLDKVKQLRQLRSDLEIEVDGGITPETIKLAADAGANRFISGSYLQNSDDVNKAVKKLKKLAE